MECEFDVIHQLPVYCTYFNGCAYYLLLSFKKKTMECWIWHHQQAVSFTSLTCCVLFLRSFSQKWNGQLMLLTDCKLYLFEWLCLLFTSFFDKTMEWWILCHQQEVSCTHSMVVFVANFCFSQNNGMVKFDAVNRK